MRNRSLVVVLLASLGLFACGGTNQQAKAPEGDPWADFKGTYAGAPITSSAKATDGKGDSAKRDLKAKADPRPELSADEAPAPPPKKTSKGTIRGESVSSIGVDTLADASKSSLKSKVVSSTVKVGSQYEQVQVQLKGGTTVQIVRPSASPDPSGPAVGAPRTRSGELSKAESGWYDEDADVIVVVTAGKKAAAQKLLGTLVKH